MSAPSVESAAAYALAQCALADLKAAIYQVLYAAGSPGLKNVDIGRSLGIYGGHVGHEGHLSRTLLAVMEAEGVVEQDQETKLWSLKGFPPKNERIPKADLKPASREDL
ncbi:MAG: hypothetical protein JJ878_16195 [Alphaproteobacteria bacterium]|nr:hypothetical protein [Alphaproteobacteria bacterium]